MSILIQGMTIDELWEYGEYCQAFIGTGQAIEIPPHGRLIDADKFERIKYEIPIKPANYSRGFHEGVMFVQKLIMDAPTIIPADREEPDEET